ncbi:MAG TPA: cyclic nucleotide-gated ion channel [Alphaproteobacteria bacterium]|nr:cyclic nucleotide-gated ion channel [Alphaproteobacteria bacterium]
MEPRKWRRLRARAYEIVEVGVTQDLPSRLFDYALAAFIVLNAFVVSLETVAPLEARYRGFFTAFEILSVSIFSIEYVVRIWTAVENPRYDPRKPWRARLRFALSFYAIVDLLAILPSIVAFVVWSDLRVFRILRLLRLLKLVRYSVAVTTLSRVFYEERRALTAAFAIMVGLGTLSASLIYFVERNAQPDVFSSVPASMWWALTTLTTVGYGDVVPVTPLGKVVGGLTMIFGIGVYALPIGIIASGFAREIHKREFVITWDMVARVPLFSDLSAQEVGQIAALLRSRVVERGTVIARKGDPAHGMYFIITGSVEIQTTPAPVQLKDGDFFGEIALLHKSKRSANVISQAKTRLMVLDAEDFQNLIEIDPKIGEHVKNVAEKREEFRRRGDITAEELAQGTVIR